MKKPSKYLKLIKPLIPKRRLCLGIGCQGRKYFKSEGKWNRICSRCKILSEQVNPMGRH